MSARPGVGQVFADIELRLSAVGGERLAEMIDEGQLVFGLWGVCCMETDEAIDAILPTSVRLLLASDHTGVYPT